MKKIVFILSLVSLFISCNSDKNSTSVERINIGDRFSSIPNSKKFNTVMPDEHFIENYKLTDPIGYVNKLNITTDDDIIIEVNFSTSEKTNIEALEKSFSNMIEEKIDTNKLSFLGNLNTHIRSFKSKDEKTFLLIEFDKNELLKNGKPIYQYHYLNSNAVNKNSRILDDILGIKRIKKA